MRDAKVFFEGLRLTEKDAAVADKILKEICRRLGAQLFTGRGALLTSP